MDLTVDKDRPAVGHHLATAVGDYDQSGAFRLSIAAPDDVPERDDLDLTMLQSVQEHDSFDSTRALLESTKDRDKTRPSRAPRTQPNGPDEVPSGGSQMREK